MSELYGLWYSDMGAWYKQRWPMPVQEEPYTTDDPRIAAMTLWGLRFGYNRVEYPLEVREVGANGLPLPLEFGHDDKWRARWKAEGKL